MAKLRRKPHIGPNNFCNGKKLGKSTLRMIFRDTFLEDYLPSSFRFEDEIREGAVDRLNLINPDDGIYEEDGLVDAFFETIEAHYGVEIANKEKIETIGDLIDCLKKL